MPILSFFYVLLLVSISLKNSEKANNKNKKSETISCCFRRQCAFVIRTSMILLYYNFFFFFHSFFCTTFEIAIRSISNISFFFYSPRTIIHKDRLHFTCFSYAQLVWIKIKNKKDFYFLYFDCNYTDESSSKMLRMFIWNVFGIVIGMVWILYREWWGEKNKGILSI